MVKGEVFIVEMKGHLRESGAGLAGRGQQMGPGHEKREVESERGDQERMQRQIARL